MYTYIYIYIYIYIFIYRCVYLHIHRHLHAYKHMYVHIHMCIHVYIDILYIYRDKVRLIFGNSHGSHFTFRLCWVFFQRRRLLRAFWCLFRGSLLICCPLIWSPRSGLAYEVDSLSAITRTIRSSAVRDGLTICYHTDKPAWHIGWIPCVALIRSSSKLQTRLRRTYYSGSQNIGTGHCSDPKTTQERRKPALTTLHPHSN